MAEAQEDAKLDSTPAGQARRWAMEFAAARKELKPFHDEGEDVVKAFLDERQGVTSEEAHLNLFTANVQTVGAMMYGKTPKVDVTRRFNDAADDAARVAALIQERLLNLDIHRASDSYAAALEHALQDFQLPGLGFARLRYVVEMEDVEGKEAMLDEETGAELAPEVPTTQRKTEEDVEVVWMHWKDVLWGPSRVWGEVPWLAFKAPMSRAELVKRFGEEVGNAVPLNSKKGDESSTDARQNHPWDRADVWEIWDKATEDVTWFVEGYGVTLETKPNPLGLEGFWPCPRPMMANLTTSRMVPKADYKLAKDQYNSINNLTTRIEMLADAVKAAGCYDRTATGLEKLLERNGGNILVPVDNWAMFQEKGGVQGVISWMPMADIAAALDKLREIRAEEIQLLFQTTGYSDIMRGQATGPATATEQSIKARFSSVRIQRMQDEFARFASDIQALKAEIVTRHFDANTLVQRSNIMQTADGQNPQLIQAAVQLLKSESSCYRIEVKPESISLTDYAAVKQERAEVLQAIAGFIQAVGPLAQATPALAPSFMGILQWMVSGMKGAQELESILDKAATQLQQQAAQPQPQQQQGPDPKVQAAQLKVQGDLMREKAKTQGALVTIQAQAQADAQHQASQTHFNILEAQAKERTKTLAGIDAAINPAGTVGGG